MNLLRNYLRAIGKRTDMSRDHHRKFVGLHVTSCSGLSSCRCYYDAKIAEFHLETIKYPEALMILWNLALPQLTGASSNPDDSDEYDSPR
jgi:hypothetical protein